MVYELARIKLLARECALCTAIAIVVLVSLPLLAIVAFALRPVLLVSVAVLFVVGVVSAGARARHVAPGS